MALHCQGESGISYWIGEGVMWWWWWCWYVESNDLWRGPSPGDPGYLHREASYKSLQGLQNDRVHIWTGCFRIIYTTAPGCWVLVEILKIVKFQRQWREKKTVKNCWTNPAERREIQIETIQFWRCNTKNFTSARPASCLRTKITETPLDLLQSCQIITPLLIGQHLYVMQPGKITDLQALKEGWSDAKVTGA